MKFRVLWVILIAALISSCADPLVVGESQSQATQDMYGLINDDSQDGQKSAFRLGQDGEVGLLNTFSFIDNSRDPLTIIIISTYDQEPLAKDDEIHFGVVIQSSDPSGVPIGEKINIPSNQFPISVVMGAHCFLCNRIPFAKGTGQHYAIGYIYFESFTPQKVLGNIYLQIQGDIPYFSLDEPFYEDLWRLDTLLELEILRFVAVPRE